MTEGAPLYPAYQRDGQPTARGPHAAHEQFLCGSADPAGEKIIWKNIICTFARIVTCGGLGAARDKTYNSFDPQW